MDKKELLKKIKAAFLGEVTPPAPPAPPTPIAKTYKLADGTTELSITQAGEVPAVGDAVMIGGAPAPANTYTLEDGATIVVDAAGVVASYTAMAAPPPPPPAPPVPPQPVTLSAEEETKPLTKEEIQAMYAKFANGTPEERIGNLETMVKALMESSFGWEIRKGQEQVAIQTYKDSLANMQTTVDTAKGEMQSAFAKVEEQVQTITKHEQTIKDLFDLVEKLVELPTADPVTLTERQKQKFDKQSARDERLSKIAEAVKKQKALA
jgi:hypothetical protein